MQKFFIVLATTGLLSGCVFMTPTEAEPTFLKNSQRFEVKGREGWMPGKNIHFGEYSSDVSKGKITGQRDVYFSGPYLEEDDARTVSIKQFGPNNTSAALEYKQYCIVKGYRPPYDEKPEYESIKVTHDPNIGVLTFNNKRWMLNAMKLTDDAGNTFSISSGTISLNSKIISEYTLGHWTGGLNNADYIWLDETAAKETKMIVATLMTYLSTVEPLPCEMRLKPDNGE
ncbi:hypothetical protein [Vibrio penaeicida]|uniref:Lipoprotein n=1 Tax=Vibrio penaeicida TaxID=104609 RepID=A0AAV5P0K5_9VIBR|nr:hypothetical protein [Vibrio penaeicida]GLQ76079.1 hypothetical protein GCM10007932_54420 [Vibrio penaeicida]